MLTGRRFFGLTDRPCPWEKRKPLTTCAGSVSLLEIFLQTLLALNLLLPLSPLPSSHPRVILYDKWKLYPMWYFGLTFYSQREANFAKVFYQLSNEFIWDKSCYIWHFFTVIRATWIIHHICSSACDLQPVFTSIIWPAPIIWQSLGLTLGSKPWIKHDPIWK